MDKSERDKLFCVKRMEWLQEPFWKRTTIQHHTANNVYHHVSYNSVGKPGNRFGYGIPTKSKNIKFNNVVYISSNRNHKEQCSGCNGIGLIASGAQSTVWFEYGETSNLDDRQHRFIGKQGNSNHLEHVYMNLKENTSYYCRAVKKNQYGQ